MPLQRFLKYLAQKNIKEKSKEAKKSSFFVDSFIKKVWKRVHISELFFSKLSRFFFLTIVRKVNGFLSFWEFSSNFSDTKIMDMWKKQQKCLTCHHESWLNAYEIQMSLDAFCHNVHNEMFAYACANGHWAQHWMCFQRYSLPWGTS